MIQVKRVYEPTNAHDGRRFLIERIWPRGVKKDDLRFAAWLKDAAPSAALREWLAREPSRWDEFLQRYYAELQIHPETLQPLLAAVRRGNVTLLFSEIDMVHNNAAALKEILEKEFQTPVPA
jgi:uncharacterized protein YeaO (DUF488 family)